MSRQVRRLVVSLPVLALLALLLLAWAVYWPGRHGSFLFDDYSNLGTLGDYGPIHSFWKAVAFITSGFAGPTGRPVALASFLLDARDWPAAPLPFKLTNVAVHLLCGAVLAGLLRALSRVSGAAPRRAAWVGVLGAGLWLLDPFWVSTTLYVVQRMAMLAALFGLAALWGYVRGRELLAQGRVRTGYLGISVSLGLGTLLATLSKENGALVPLLAWVLEAWVLRRRLGAPEGSGLRSGRRCSWACRRRWWSATCCARPPACGADTPAGAISAPGNACSARPASCGATSATSGSPARMTAVCSTTT